MQIRKFRPDPDLKKLEAFLRRQYLANQNMTSWLPERLHDLVYRIAPQESAVGRKESKDYIFLWEEQGEIVACILPDGENIYFSIQKGHEHPFSSLYPDSFECIVVDENAQNENDVCACCFVYVDRESGTALIEPVSTREKYRRKGIGTAMMHGVIQRCKEKGIQKCYVNSFGWRKQFYNAAGFVTEDSTGFWYITISKTETKEKTL